MTYHDNEVKQMVFILILPFKKESYQVDKKYIWMSIMQEKVYFGHKRLMAKPYEKNVDTGHSKGQKGLKVVHCV